MRLLIPSNDAVACIQLIILLKTIRNSIQFFFYKTSFNFQFWVQYVKSLEAVTPILTMRKKLNKLKINNSSCIHQRIEVTQKTESLKTGETDRWIQRTRIYWRRILGAETSMGTSIRVENPKM